MAVLARLAPAVGAEAAGCAAMAAVFSHLAQTCADFWLVSRWVDGWGMRSVVRRQGGGVTPWVSTPSH